MKSEKLKSWALIAEIIGGIAVIVTLVFLVVETRENTNALKAQTYQDLMQQVNNFREIILNNKQRYELEEKLERDGWESLTRAEQQDLRLPIQINWGIYESAYYANERGVLGEDEWVRFQIQICRNWESRNRLYWYPPDALSLDELLTPVFLSYVKNNCENR